MVEFKINPKCKPSKAASKDKTRPTLFEALSIQRLDDPFGKPRTCLVATDSYIAVAVPLEGTLLPTPTGKRRERPLTVSRAGIEALEKSKLGEFKVNVASGEIEVGGVVYPEPDVGAYPVMATIFNDQPAFYVSDRKALSSGFNGGAAQIAWNPALAKRLGDAMGVPTGGDLGKGAMRLTMLNALKPVVAEAPSSEAFGLLMPVRSL